MLSRCSLTLAICLILVTAVAADPVPVQWDTLVTHPAMYVEGETPGEECVGLIVSNHGGMGYIGIGGVNLDFVESGLECGTRPEDGIYLSSGSPYVIIADDADGTNAQVTCSYGDVDGSRPYSWIPVNDVGVMTHGLMYREWYDTLYTGRFVNRTGAVAMERTYLVPADMRSPSATRHFVVLYTKLYSADGAPHDHITVGNVIDWNIPSDPVNNNVSVLNPGYSCGLYMQGVDQSGTSCQDHSRRFGGEVFGGMNDLAQNLPSYTWCEDWPEDYPLHGMHALPQELLHDTNHYRDGTDLVPDQPNGQVWWQETASPGLHPDAEAGDQAIWMTYLYDFSLEASDTIYFWSVLTPVRSGDAYYLEDYAQEGIWWYRFVRYPECSCDFGLLGDANNSYDDHPTIGDITCMIEFLFLNDRQYGIVCPAEADVNMSCGTTPDWSDITIGDISFLIDYLFIAGPQSGTLPYCWERY
jgi:hypothetical protein